MFKYLKKVQFSLLKIDRSVCLNLSSSVVVSLCSSIVTFAGLEKWKCV